MPRAPIAGHSSRSQETRKGNPRKIREGTRKGGTTSQNDLDAENAYDSGSQRKKQVPLAPGREERVYGKRGKGVSITKKRLPARNGHG